MILDVLRCKCIVWKGREGENSVFWILSLQVTLVAQAMTWPLVIPKNADEPTATTVFLRFCQ